MKNFLVILLVIFLIISTSLVKSSTRKLEAKIFNTEEQIKILNDKKELILLENNFLSSPERLFELNKLFFKGDLIPLKFKKFININRYEK
tara:strand:+ start:1528 stop:1797 length:270 start_codon:yes stop_codon:yes gene_type:complete